MRELECVRQDQPRQTRRWFRDDFFDLFVWHSESGEITAFQLCYDIQRNERVLAWHRRHGFTHNRIDSGEQTPFKDRAPIFVADGLFPFDRVLPRFEAASRGLDPGVRAFLLARISEYKSINLSGFPARKR